MRKGSEKVCTESPNTNFKIKSFFENRAVYEIMWKNTIEPDTPQMTTWRTRISCRIITATSTHSECVIFIAFPLQQWFHERSSLLPNRYIGCFVVT
jgi:hypothetical protein